MGRIVVTEFMSLDGVMEDPGGSEKSRYGGWAFQFDRGPEGDKFKNDELFASEAMLLGRVTYQGFAAAWPSRTGEFADKFNAMKKYVVSTTLQRADWNNSEIIKSDVVNQISKLRAAKGGDILVHGSGTLVQTLFQNVLVDELRLMVFPIVLGGGKPLFREGFGRLPLHLIESKPVGAGILTLVYHLDQRQEEQR